MNRKQAKSLLAYGLLAFFLVLASVVLVKAITSFSSGDSDLSISYNLVTEAKAGRAYTPTCLTDCHLPFCITPSGNSLPSVVPLTEKDVTHSLNFAEGADQSILKEIGVDYLTTETYSVSSPVFGTCQGERLSNETGQIENYSYECVVSYGQESRTKEVWKPLKDISQLNLETGKEQCFDIWGKLQLTANSNFAVDVIPHVSLQNSEFVMSELAWWNSSSVSYRRRHIGNYSFNSSVKDMPCLINGSWGFGDGSVTNYVWGKCDYKDTYLHYNSIASDYYLANDSGDIQLPIQTEGRNGPADYNPDSVWDGFTLVILPNESQSNNTGSIRSLGQIKDEINFTTNCSRVPSLSVSQVMNITSDSYIRTGLNTPGTGCSGLRTTQSNTYNCTSCTFEAIFKYTSWGNQNGDFLVWWNTAGSIRRFQLISGNDLDSAASPGPNACSWDTNFDPGHWYYIAIIFQPNSSTNNLSVFVGAENGSAGWKANCYPNNPYGWNISDALYIGGNPNAGPNSFNGIWDMITLQNVSRSRAWIEARYNNTLLRNASRLLGQEVSNSTATESDGDGAIRAGITGSIVPSGNSNFTSQQLYSRLDNGTQKFGKFDWVVVSGNQTWAFNYVSSNEDTSNVTSMSSMAPVLYVWENQNLTVSQIQSQVTSLINSTYNASI